MVIIFSKIDIATLKENFLRADPVLVTAGLLLFPAAVLIGAWRWRTILSFYLSIKPPLGFMLKHYYIGLSVGMFGPASIGWDIYRVIAVGKKLGHYGLNVAAVLAEKLLAFLIMILLAVAVYPLIRSEIVTNAALILSVMKYAYAALGLVIVVAVAVTLLQQHWITNAIISAVERFAAKLISRLKISIGDNKDLQPTLSLSELVSPLVRAKPVATILLMSLAIQVVSAAGNTVLFKAIGYNVPFTVNLFLTPVFFFIFILPISFGSLGIREGSYVLLYGLFGVPAEAALLVSFLCLLGLVLNQIIGAILIWEHALRRPNETAPSHAPD